MPNNSSQEHSELQTLPAPCCSLGYRGALADCLLWLLIRVQTHIFASATYDQVQHVVQQEEAQEAAEVVAEVRVLHGCALTRASSRCCLT